MADTLGLTPEVRTFMEKARAEGHSDEEIVSYVKQHYTHAESASPKSSLPTLATSDSPESSPTLLDRVNSMLGPLAHPTSTTDMIGLALPNTGGMGAIRSGIPLAAKAAQKLGEGLEYVGAKAKPSSLAIGVIDALTRGSLTEGAMATAAPYVAEATGRGMQRAGAAVENFQPYRINMNPPERLGLPAHPDESFVKGVSAVGEQKQLPAGPIRMASGPDPSFVRGVPAEPASGLVTGEPVGIEPTTRGPVVEGEVVPRPGLPSGGIRLAPSQKADPSFVRGVPAQPAMSSRPALPPKPTAIEMPASTNDPSFVRGVAAQPAAVERSVAAASEAAPTLESEVQRLSKDGMGAEDIANTLKDRPELSAAKSKAERVNLVREARGGDAGQVPARVKKAIDDALGQLKTAEEKRAYLLKAPNAQVYAYIKSRL